MFGKKGEDPDRDIPPEVLAVLEKRRARQDAFLNQKRLEGWDGESLLGFPPEDDDENDCDELDEEGMAINASVRGQDLLDWYTNPEITGK
jgi:hypothetical protein